MRRVNPSDATLITVGQVLTAAVSSIALIVTSRSFGADGRGSLVIVQSIVALSVAGGILGLPTLVLRMHNHHLRWPTLGYWTVLSIATTWTLAWVLVNTSSAAQKSSFASLPAVIAALALVYIMAEMYAANLQRQQRFLRLAVSRASWTCAGFGALAIGAAETARVESALWSSCLAMGAVLAVVAVRDVYAQRNARGRVDDRKSGSQTPALATPIIEALRAHVSLLLLLLVYRLDVLVLASLAPTDQVGYYSIAYAAAEVAWMYVNGHATTVMGRASSRDHNQGTRALAAATRASLLACGVMSVMLLTTGYFVFPWVFGSAFRESYFTFALMIPGIIAFVPFKLRYSFAVGSGRVRGLATVTALMVLVNLGTLVPLGSAFGAKGAAASASCTYIVGALMLFRKGRRW